VERRGFVRIDAAVALQTSLTLPVLPLWDALEFQRTAEVPHGDRLGFIILQSGAAEVMYQTLDSVRADDVRIGSDFGRAGFFIVERRKTFYGSTETILRDAAGNTVILAEMEK